MVVQRVQSTSSGSVVCALCSVALLLCNRAANDPSVYTIMEKAPTCLLTGTNLVLGPPEKFYRRNHLGTFWDVHWYHLGDPKKVPGAPSQGFLTFLGFDENITKIEIWLSYPHFWADFQVSYYFGKLLTARLQGFFASKNQSLDQ